MKLTLTQSLNKVDIEEQFNLRKRSNSRPTPKTLEQSRVFNYNLLEVSEDQWISRKGELYLLEFMKWYARMQELNFRMDEVTRSQAELLYPFMKQMFDKKVKGFEWVERFACDLDKSFTRIADIPVYTKQENPKLFDEEAKLRFTLNNQSRIWDVVGSNPERVESLIGLKCKFAFADAQVRVSASKMGLNVVMTGGLALDSTRGILVIDVDEIKNIRDRISKLDLWSAVIVV